MEPSRKSARQFSPEQPKVDQSLASSSVKQATKREVRTRDVFRWSSGHPQTSEYYYDEPVPAFVLDKKNWKHADLFPPANLYLSDAWTVAIITSNLSGRERNSRYPTVFGTKYLSTEYTSNGQASKRKVMGNSYWTYTVGFGTYEFHGEEGRSYGLDPNWIKQDPNTVKHSDHRLDIGRRCIVQNTEYDLHEQNGQAQAQQQDQAEGQKQAQKRKLPTAALPVSASKRLRTDAGFEAKHEGSESGGYDSIGTSEFSVPRSKKGKGKAPGRVEMFPDPQPEVEAPSDASKENEKLRARLSQAEGKVVYLATVLEEVHRVVAALAGRTQTVIEESWKRSDGLDARELEALRTKNGKEVEELLRSMNDTLDGFHEDLPGMSTRVTIHNDDDSGPSQEFTAWRGRGGPDHQRLVDEGDADLTIP